MAWTDDVHPDGFNQELARRVADWHEPLAFLAVVYAPALLDEAGNVQQPAFGNEIGSSLGGLTVCVSRGWTEERRPGGKALWRLLC
jgi:hypothetical protein